MSVVRCGRCDNVAPSGTPRCPNCGAPLATPASGPSGFRLAVNLLGGTVFLVGAVAAYLSAQAHAPERFPMYPRCVSLTCVVREHPDDWYFSADGLLLVTLLAVAVGVGSAVGIAQTLILQARAGR